MTFSKSLAQFLADKKYDIKVFEAVSGKALQPNESSSTGLYGIVSSINNKLLRVSLSKDHANFITQDQFRYLTECHLR